MKRLACSLCLFSLWSSGVTAAWPSEGALFSAPAKEFGVPENVLTALAQVESAGNPWAVNVAGQSFYCRSKEDALARAGAALAAGRSFDLGLMQINAWWLKKLGLSLEAALDPRTNVRLAGWILKQELERWGDLRRAVGSYHSPRPHLAEPYAANVWAALARLSGAQAVSAVSALPSVPAAPSAPAIPSSLHPVAHSRIMKVPGTAPLNSMKARKRHD